jgi:hypothetical protein
MTIGIMLILKHPCKILSGNGRYIIILLANRKGLVFFGTPHGGGNGDEAKVNIGLIAAGIAKKLGFNSHDSIVEVLKPGSLFGDFLRESFRPQLEYYFIVSFWDKESTVSPLICYPRW